eukprot:6192994-Pleurochrysis_carterae.AAC.2
MDTSTLHLGLQVVPKAKLLKQVQKWLVNAKRVYDTKVLMDGVTLLRYSSNHKRRTGGSSCWDGLRRFENRLASATCYHRHFCAP